MLGVGVEVFLPAVVGPEDLQVAEQVDDHEAHQNQAGEGDDPLFADGGLGDGDEGIHLREVPGKATSNERVGGPSQSDSTGRTQRS